MKKIIRELSVFLSVWIITGVMLPTYAAKEIEYTRDGIIYVLKQEYHTAEIIGTAEKLSGEIILPGKVTYKGDAYAVHRIDDRAFENQTGITCVKIEEGIYQIAPKAFSGCTSLKEVYLPDSLRQLASNAFDGCPNPKVYGFKSSSNLGTLALTTNIDFDFFDIILSPADFFRELWNSIVFFFDLIGKFFTGELHLF